MLRSRESLIQFIDTVCTFFKVVITQLPYISLNTQMELALVQNNTRLKQVYFILFEMGVGRLHVLFLTPSELACVATGQAYS